MLHPIKSFDILTCRYALVLVMASLGLVIGGGTLNSVEAIETGVVCNRFVLQWELDGTDLLLAIDTDLPDTAEAIVSVERLYYEVESTEAYARDYFSERGLISKWRNPRRIPIDDVAWSADLKMFQSKMATLSSDLAFTVDYIEDQITIDAVVHMDQPDPKFGGLGNPNLFGAAVSQTKVGSSYIRAEQKIPWPLNHMPPPKSSKYVAWNKLETGKSYRFLKETPLMATNTVPRSNFEQTMEALGETLYIPAGRIIRVISVDHETGPDPWYEVEVVGDENAKGWINSIALMGSSVTLE